MSDCRWQIAQVVYQFRTSPFFLQAAKTYHFGYVGPRVYRRPGAINFCLTINICSNFRLKHKPLENPIVWKVLTQLLRLLTLLWTDFLNLLDKQLMILLPELADRFGLSGFVGLKCRKQQIQRLDPCLYFFDEFCFFRSRHKMSVLSANTIYVPAGCKREPRAFSIFT